MVAHSSSIVNPNRIRILNPGNPEGKIVLYWMQKDKRVDDNWALLYAQEVALKNNCSLMVCFTFIGKFPEANIRQYSFLFEGLKETERTLNQLNIPFHMIQGKCDIELLKFIKKEKIGLLVTDFSPLRIHRRRTKQVCDAVNIPAHQVDANNIIPAWKVSNKQEWSAYTLRRKMQKHLGEYLTDFPNVKRHPIKHVQSSSKVDWKSTYANLSIDQGVKEIDWLKPGEKAGIKQLHEFLSQPIEKYTSQRNDPNRDVLTNLSPYLHYGQISSQRVALHLQEIDTIENKSILEQIVVRRELAVNFCFYNDNYDNIDGFPNWAKESLREHWNDPRDYLYPHEAFEAADTHDPLWNAAQSQMVHLGKMHTYMRMYWAKKILEWSPNPEVALQIAIDLNDKYELDGRDSNGYTGIAWSIGGVHDRPWFERPIFGKIRFMSFNGCKNKFNINHYISDVDSLKSL